MKNIFKPHHINATQKNFEGNTDIGRYIFLANSDHSAHEIAGYFDDVTIEENKNGHPLYLGELDDDGKKIHVGAISTGLGCPSAEIILHELFYLGARRFLRVGTAKTLQPDFVPPGHFINVQASTRDESTTQHYAPASLPAIASLEFVSSTLLAAAHLNLSEYLHTGIVHCKNSLYAEPETQNYFTDAGVLATEMETATLFIQSQFYNQLLRTGKNRERVLAGAILGITDTPHSKEAEDTLHHSIQIGLETIKILAAQELLD